MQTITYLNGSFHNEKLCRWTDRMMPLGVYIKKFNWYKSTGINDEYKYTQMIIDAFNLWEKLSGGIVSFTLARNLYESQINIEWRRVDRKSLGDCTHTRDTKTGIYYAGAEITIGLSDGIIHHEYMDENEVFHTILHEIGHSIGLGHSSTKGDIMYVPHEYGIVNISQNDLKTLEWLYKLPIGATQKEILAQYPVIKAKNIDDLVIRLENCNNESEFEKTKNDILNSMTEKDLLQENENIGDLKKYLMELNNIKFNFKPKQ